MNSTLMTIGIAFWIFIFIIIIISIVTKSKPNSGKQTQKARPKYLYTAKKHIMTSHEEKFFKILCEIFEHKCYVIPQVHLSALLNHKVKGQDWRSAFYHINGKSVDFVLCRRSDLSPLCAIELDDSSHDSVQRIERDVEVERIFQYANLPLVRFRNTESLSKQDIVNQLSSNIRMVE